MRTTSTLFTLLAILWTLAASPALAKDDTLEFLHLLQREGYADVAIDYLDQLKADPNAPKEVMALWDLEMSRSMKDAARQKLAYNDAQAKQWSEQSKTLLDQFLKANPDKPEAIQEAAKWSEERAVEAQYNVLKASYATDKAERDKLLADARKIFEDIRPRLVDAEKASANMLAKLPPLRANSPVRVVRQHEDAKFLVGENRLTVAMVDFYLAHTLESGTPRNDALAKTAKEFDAIFQDFREVFLGTRAHFWNGRICQELNQIEDAKAIYEEVLARDARNIDDVSDGTPTARTRIQKKKGPPDFFAIFFADVEQYYLQTLYQLSKKDYLEEVKSWRASHKANSEDCYGYQALTYEYAKNLLDLGERSKTAAKQDKGTRDAIKSLNDMAKNNRLPEEGFPKLYALRLLGEMAKIPSPYQEGAIKLRRQLNPNPAPGEGFEDAVIDGDAALLKKNWSEAIESYEKALAAATTKTDKDRLANLKNTLVACYHNLALQLYQKGDKANVELAIATAKKALKPGFLQTKAAPGLAVFLLNVVYYQYVNAPEKTDEEKKAKAELLTKVSNTAKSILALKEWASREEGDAARIVLLRLALAQDNVAEADKLLAEINPNSREYPRALTVMGFAHWFKYRTAKRQIAAETAANKPVAADRLAKLEDDRKQALEYTRNAVEKTVPPAAPRADGAPAADSLRETQLLLAEIYTDIEDYKNVIATYKPMVDAILKDSSKPFDETTLRILTGACQAYLKLNDVENATAVGGKLLELGPDQAQVNSAILTFARHLDSERTKAMAESDAADPAAQGAAAARVKSLTDLQEKVMVNLSKREKLAVNSMIWLVKTSANLGTDDCKVAAADLIKKIFVLSDNNNDVENELKRLRAEIPLHAMGATLMADLGKYQDAKNQIDEMIAKFPKALDPRLREAEILTKWAAKENDPEKYSQAIATWDTLRKKLEAMSARANPAEKDPNKVEPKYEVIEKEARCFLEMAQKTKNREDEAKDYAKKGYDLVGPYLSLDASIRTPNEAYKEISFKFFQVGGKLADFLGQARPIRPKAKRSSPTR